MRQVRTLALALALLTNVSLLARTMGREQLVTASPSAQQHVALSRDDWRTLLAWEETAAPGELSRVLVHQYEAPSWSLGRATFTVQPSPRHQRMPVFGNSMIAWLEDDPSSTATSVWYQPIQIAVGKNYQPIGPAEKVGDAARGTRLHVLNYHVFHALVWTAPDGRLMTAERSLIARIGYDPTPWYLTTDRAVNPAAGEQGWDIGWPLIAYNVEVPGRPCQQNCERLYAVKATVHGGRQPQKSIFISGPGASAPDVVETDSESLIFWSDVRNGGTFVQRMSTAAGDVIPIGASQRVHDGQLHDASIAANQDVVMVVQAGAERFVFVRLDRDLRVVESIPFTAKLAGESRMRISSVSVPNPMIAYTTLAADGVTPRAVFRLVEDAPGTPKRRAIR